MKPIRSASAKHTPPKAGPLRRGINALGVGLLTLFYHALGRFPERFALGISAVLGAVISPAIRGRQLANYAALFPDASRSEIRRLRAGHQAYHTRLRVQLCRLNTTPVDSLLSEVTFTGGEHLREALASGRGVLVAGGHMGTWCHVALCVARSGSPCSSIINPLMNAPIAGWMREIGSRYGVTLNPVNQGAHRAAREAFRKNEVFFVAMDFNVRPDRGHRLPLLGAGLDVDPGPALLALRYGPVVLWASCRHDSSGRSIVELSPAMATGPGTTLDSPAVLCAEWTRRLEQDVGRWPEQWWGASFCSLSPRASLPSAATMDGYQTS